MASWGDSESPRATAEAQVATPTAEPQAALVKIEVGTLSTIACVHSLILLENTPERGIFVTADAPDTLGKIGTIEAFATSMRLRYTDQPADTKSAELVGCIEKAIDLLMLQEKPVNVFLHSRVNLAIARLNYIAKRQQNRRRGPT